MEWSLGMEPWSGVLEWILEWNEVNFGVRGLSQKVVDFLYNKKTLRSIATKFYM